MTEKGTPEDYIRKMWLRAGDCVEGQCVVLREVALEAVKMTKEEIVNFTECIACGRKQAVHCIDCGLDAIAKTEQRGYEKGKKDGYHDAHNELDERMKAVEERTRKETITAIFKEIENIDGMTDEDCAAQFKEIKEKWLK